VTKGKQGKNGKPVFNRYLFFRYADRLTGKDRQLGIGPLDTVGLAGGRTVAKRCREQLLAGIDPIEQRNAERSSQALAEARATTFGDYADRFIEARKPEWKNAKSCEQWHH
jgi:hypothetical protein